MQASRKIGAWQPFTPQGVAQFARGSLKRLILVQLIFAALVAAAVVWLLATAWFPAVDEAIRQFPDGGEIRAGRLTWPGDQPRLLVEGHFLAIAVDLKHTGRLRSPAHLQLELGENEVRIISLAGYTVHRYPDDGWIVDLNRTEAEAWWGAWGTPILWIAFVVVIAMLMVLWALLATVWYLPVWLLGFFANRDLKISESWKLAGAAWMPGALVPAMAIVLYGMQVLDLVQLAAAAGVYLVAGSAYCLAGPFLAPKLPSATGSRRNPFTGR